MLDKYIRSTLVTILRILMIKNYKSSLLLFNKYIIIIFYGHFPSKKKNKCSSSSLECLKQLQRGNSEQIKLTEKYMSCSEFHSHNIKRSTREFYVVKL